MKVGQSQLAGRIPLWPCTFCRRRHSFPSNGGACTSFRCSPSQSEKRHADHTTIGTCYITPGLSNGSRSYLGDPMG